MMATYRAVHAGLRKHKPVYDDVGALRVYDREQRTTVVFLVVSASVHFGSSIAPFFLKSASIWSRAFPAGTSSAATFSLQTRAPAAACPEITHSTFELIFVRNFDSSSFSLYYIPSRASTPNGLIYSRAQTERRSMILLVVMVNVLFLHPTSGHHPPTTYIHICSKMISCPHLSH